MKIRKHKLNVYLPLKMILENSVDPDQGLHVLHLLQEFMYETIRTIKLIRQPLNGICTRQFAKVELFMG